MFIYEKLEEKMEDCACHFKSILKSLRTGRANTSMLAECKIQAYGSSAKLKEIALLNVSSFDTIEIVPFDSGIVKEVLGSLNSQDRDIVFKLHDNKIIASIPPITAEYKASMVRSLSKELEVHKVCVRKIRMLENNNLKNLKKKSEITEDEFSKYSKQTDNLTSRYTNVLDKEFALKKQELNS